MGYFCRHKLIFQLVNAEKNVMEFDYTEVETTLLGYFLRFLKLDGAFLPL